MGDVQLPIFKQKSFGKVVQRQIVEPVVPTGEMSLMQTLPGLDLLLVWCTFYIG
jgi:hypothetical protein